MMISLDLSWYLRNPFNLSVRSLMILSFEIRFQSLSLYTPSPISGLSSSHAMLLSCNTPFIKINSSSSLLSSVSSLALPSHTSSSVFHVCPRVCRRLLEPLGRLLTALAIVPSFDSCPITSSLPPHRLHLLTTSSLPPHHLLTTSSSPHHHLLTTSSPSPHHLLPASLQFTPP